MKSINQKLIEALQGVLAMHAMPTVPYTSYRDNLGAMAKAREVLAEAKKTRWLCWGQLETRNFCFDAFGDTDREVMDALRDACAKHAMQHGVDATYFLDLIDAEDGGINIRWLRVEPGHVYRDGERIDS